MSDLQANDLESQVYTTEDEAAAAFDAVLNKEGYIEPGHHQTDDEPVDEADDAEAADETEEPVDEPEDDDDAEEVEESQQELYTITVNGEQVDVTLDELRAGYQRQKDYTQKTQAIAEAKKQNQQLVNAYSQKLQELDNIAQYLEANPDIPEPQIDWQKLYDSDPVEWSVQRQLYNERERVRQNRAAQINLVKQEQQSLAQQQFAGHLQEQRERLLELVPEWKDKQVAAVEKREIRDFAISQFGMNQQDVDNAFDAKLVAMLRSAYLYHKGTDKAQKVTKPAAEKAVRTQGRRNRPDSPRTDLKKAQERLQKTGSVEDAAAVFEKMFG